jgi:cytochrome c553
MSAKLAAALSLLAACGLSTASLAAGTQEAGQAKSTACVACHGIDGNSANPEWPSIAG